MPLTRLIFLLATVIAAAAITVFAAVAIAPSLGGTATGAALLLPAILIATLLLRRATRPKSDD